MKLSPETCLNWPECCCSGECDDDRRRWRGGALFIVITCLAAWAIIFGALWLVLRIDSAAAHEAIPTAAQPLGWAYDYSCCSLADCREVKASAVKVDSDGYTIVATGELLAYGDKRIRRSKDEFFHWCSVAGLADSKSLCLYVPDGTF